MVNNFSPFEVFQPEYKKYEENKSMASFFAFLVLVILIFQIIFNVVLGGVLVEGTSMYPTIKNGAHLMMNKWGNATRGDVVVIDVSTSIEEKLFIKRLIAIEGDSLYIENGVVYLKKAGENDFFILEEDYINKPWTINNNFKSKTEPLILGEDEIFFMGDNRNVSKDNRDFSVGIKKQEDILGVILSFYLK